MTTPAMRTCWTWNTPRQRLRAWRGTLRWTPVRTMLTYVYFQFYATISLTHTSHPHLGCKCRHRSTTQHNTATFLNPRGFLNGFFNHTCVLLMKNQDDIIFLSWINQLLVMESFLLCWIWSFLSGCLLFTNFRLETWPTPSDSSVSSATSGAHLPLVHKCFFLLLVK